MIFCVLRVLLNWPETMADMKDINPSPDGSVPKLRNRLAMLSGDLPQPIVEGSRTSTTVPLFNPAAPFPKASPDGLNFLESIGTVQILTSVLVDLLALNSDMPRDLYV